MRPLNLGETLDASIKIVRARWRTLAMVMVAIALPIQIANVIIVSSTTDVYKVGSGSWLSSSSSTTYGDEGTYVAGRTAMIALSILGYLLGTVACYRAIADTYLGRPTGARASLSYAGNRLGTTLWLTIVLFVGLVAAFIALILPGIWLAVAWSVAFPVMLVEGTGGFVALKRSFKLTEGRWWATLGRLLVAYILVQVVSTVAALVFIVPAELVVDDTSFGALVLESAASVVASLITTPFIAAVVMLVYFDLRVRKEGFDLALLAERMDDGDRAGSVPPPAPASASASDSASGSWAPPVAPEPRRPPSQDG